jgi:hypothetical protein
MLPLTYPDLCANEIGEFIGIKCIDTLRRSLRLEKMGLDRHYESGELNVVQALDVLDKYPLDFEKTDLTNMFFLTSVGDSAKEHEFVQALSKKNACPPEKNRTIVSMTLSNGKTLDGVGEPWNAHEFPLHKSISFDPETPFKNWGELSEKLYTDLCILTHCKKYEVMFHTGCSAKDWQRTAAGGFASSWRFIEHWSMLLVIACIRHALKHLTRNGQLYLKIRHFERTETLGIITLLAQAFETYEIYGPVIKDKTFVTFIGKKFKGEDDLYVQIVSEHIKKCTNFNPATIFFHNLMHTDKSKEVMQHLTEESRKHVDLKCSLETQFQYCLYIVKEMLVSENHDQVLQKFVNDMTDRFGIDLELCHEIKLNISKVYKCISANNTDKNVFLRVMQTKWMKCNNGDPTLQDNEMYHHIHSTKHTTKFGVHFLKFQ